MLARTTSPCFMSDSSIWNSIAWSYILANSTGVPQSAHLSTFCEPTNYNNASQVLCKNFSFCVDFNQLFQIKFEKWKKLQMYTLFPCINLALRALLLIINPSPKRKRCGQYTYYVVYIQSPPLSVSLRLVSILKEFSSGRKFIDGLSRIKNLQYNLC